MSETSNPTATDVPIRDDESGEQLVPPESLTQTPRELTRRARWRSWNELPVRTWVILSLTVALITIYFTVDKYLSGRYERWLINEGMKIPAEVMLINGTQDRRIEFKRTDRLQVQVGYTLPDGQKFEWVDGWLAQLPDQKPTPAIRVGNPIEIRVDPNNPRSWTDRTEPLPWVAEFTIVVLLLPLLALLMLVALFRRQQVLNVWRHGQVSPTIVLEHKQTAAAPLSRVIRFTPADGSDRRVFSTLHPAKDLPPIGEVLWVIHPRNNPARSIVASLYE